MEKWRMHTAEEEPLILQQFLREGEASQVHVGKLPHQFFRKIHVYL
jgi:hypothetical protein